MRGGAETFFNSYEKQFDKKVMNHISGKKDIIRNIENTKTIVTELNSKIVKAYEQIDKVKDKNVVDPRLLADISNFNEIIPFCKFIKSEYQPLNKIRIELVQLMSSLGYNNLDGLLQFFIGCNYETIFNENIVSI
jgi:hypothetical protein